MAEENVVKPTAKRPTSTEKSVESAIRAGVDQWINDHLRNTEFSRDTLAWNKLQAALPHLAGAIIKEVG